MRELARQEKIHIKEVRIIYSFKNRYVPALLTVLIFLIVHMLLSIFYEFCVFCTFACVLNSVVYFFFCLLFVVARTSTITINNNKQSRTFF